MLQGFVTCAYGVHTVGRVLVLYGVCNALSSIGFGLIFKRVGCLPLLLLGATINLGVIAAMLVWQPSPSTLPVVYAMAAAWATADAIWQTQINSLYGSLFINHEKAAFSNYKLWESLGFLFAFVTSATGVCILPKIIIMIISLVCGMAGYFMIEYIQREEKSAK